MKFNNTLEFPSLVNSHYENFGYYPEGWQEIANRLFEKAEEVSNKWRGVGVKDLPFSQPEIDMKMGARARDSSYESYPVYCAHKGSRPSEWDHLYDSKERYDFSRIGNFEEAKIGDWYLVLGFDFD